MPRRVTSRPVSAGDRPFLLRLYAATRADEVAAFGWDERTLRVFLEQQFRARDAGWASTAVNADDELLLRDEEPVGRLVLDRRADGIRVVDIALMPAQQRHGIGTALLTQVVAEGDRTRQPVRLEVLAGSPAVRLYERLGFRTTGGDGVRLAMERPPRPGGQASTAT